MQEFVTKTYQENGIWLISMEIKFYLKLFLSIRQHPAKMSFSIYFFCYGLTTSSPLTTTYLYLKLLFYASHVLQERFHGEKKTVEKMGELLKSLDISRS